jgi:DNA polymerase-4/protein ImuB
MKIACVLITHLPMKAELMRRPDLRDRPVIVTEGPDSKEVVLDSSPEARGVVPGMPLQEAMSRSKAAVLLKADASHYESVFTKMITSLCQRSPLVEKGEMGCAYVGLDGLEKMYGGETRLVTSMLNAVPHNLNPRVGVASGKFMAYVAALSGRGGQATRVPEGGAAGFLRDLTVDALPLPWEDRTRLRRFGIHTIGHLATMELGPIQAQFGPAGRRAWELANGRDLSSLVPHKAIDAVNEYLTFPTPTVTLDALLVATELLLGRAFARPVLRSRYVRMATLEAKVMLGAPWIRGVAFRDAVGGKEMATRTLRATLEGTVLPGPLEDLGLTLSGLTGESGIQASLFTDMRRQEQLREMMRQMEVRLRAKPPIFKVKDIEPWSRIPERRQALVQFDP